MKSLEQDALKAQMVIAKSKEGRKRSTLEQLAESPSPAPTPSPTPLEGTGSEIPGKQGGDTNSILVCAKAPRRGLLGGQRAGGVLTPKCC